MSQHVPQRLAGSSSQGPATTDKTPYDQGAVNYTPSQAGTSYAGSLAGETNDGHSGPGQTPSGLARSMLGATSDAQSGRAGSLYSYDSARDASKFVKEVEGRTFQVLSDTYYLPSDDDEQTRLNKQHIAIKIGLSNYLYPAPEVVKAVLRPDGRGRKRILDLGCGTGAWTLEMAHEFPHAEVTGVDLVPCNLESNVVPSNCRFEVDDINLGLSHFKGQFDLVHCRLICSGLKNIVRTMRDVEECLRPGGMVIWMDVDFDMYSNDRFAYRHFATDDNPTQGSWFQRIVFEMRRGAVKGGSDLYTAARELDAGFWSHELLDPATCKSASLYLPLGPWAQCRNTAQTQMLLYSGFLMRQDSISMQRAIHPMLMKVGWPQATLEEWSRKAEEELGGWKEPLWARMMVAWGRKRADTGQPAPHVTPTNEVPAVPFPMFYEYASQEHSLRMAAARNQPKNIPPPPLPTSR